MSQDKGQNQVVIDWLTNGEPDRVFVSSPEGSITYRDVLEMMPDQRTTELSTVAPRLDLASVIEIYVGLASGPLLISSGRGWSGFQVPDDVMTVLATSGTTGQPKLVPLTVDNWEAAVRSSAIHLGHRPDDVWLAAMPLHHVGGLSILFRSSHVGGGVRLLPKFDPASFADALSGEVTIASVVPTMLRRVLEHDTRHFEGLKAVLVGGGAIPPGLLEEAAARGLPVLPTYGMTETCAQVATLRPGSPIEYRADLLPGIEARIEADGRISLRGEQVVSGYLGEPPRQPGEWFTTGDRGELVGRSLRVLGRADDVIVSGGENVDPIRVEAAIAQHPDVIESMVVGVPSDEWGSAVVCLYVGRAPSQALGAWARDRLRAFEVPKKWISVEALPRTELGKPDRNGGREQVIRYWRD